MKLRSLAFLLVLLVVAAGSALAQNPTGTLSGRVTDGQEPLPGVSVVVRAPTLQGERRAETSAIGDYTFRFLPPGEYSVRFELSGFQTLDTTIKISVAQSSRLDAVMPMTQITDQVTVVGSYETISTSNEAAATMTYDQVNALPLSGSITSYAALAPGVSSTGPGGNLIIAGAMSFENLYMVNGVNIQDNVRLTPHPLYIEDAVQETTTATAGISAEYGRFAGGVINMVTKSGGNDLHGSLRLSLSSEKWRERAPLEVGTLDDTINQTYQATLGGRILRDRLWYFVAGRSRSSETTEQTYVTNTPYTFTDDELRYEAKLTWGITANHRVVGSYIKVDEDAENDYYRESRIMDTRSLFDPSYPASLLSFNYSGVLTDNLFLEAQFSKKEYSKENAGATQYDRINGTLCIDSSRGGLTYRWWSPTQSMKAGPEQKNNEEILLKTSYFLSTASLGTHDIATGYNHFTDVREFNNYQSGSDFRVIGSSAFVRDGQIFPRWLPGTSVYIQWNPILDESKGTDFVTESVFINDKWRLNKNLSFNLGVRYDRNDGRDSLGKLVSKDDNVSPRLGLSWDLQGDGNWLVNASYGKYVGALANTVGNSTSTGGRAAQFQWNYRGPAINQDTNAANLLDTAAALQIVFDWFDSQGGTANTTYRRTPTLPGLNTIVKGTLRSPNAQDYTLGVTKRLGSRGTVRADLVHREFKDFYILQRDMETGQVDTPYGILDMGWYTNDDGRLERTYDGLQMQMTYQASKTLAIGGTWTISRIYGNVVGETSADGPTSFSGFTYPEYSDQRWSNPKGEMGSSQRHRARIWAVWDAFSTRHHRMSVSLMQSFFSGTPYGASGSVNTRPYVTNPGYVTVPTSVTYYFTDRDKWKTEDITRTDLSINYYFKVPLGGTDLQLFIQPAVTNVFNEKGIENVNTAVLTNVGTSYLATFNPFQVTPTECPQGQTTACSGNWQKGADFGKPTGPSDYQNPRTFSLSFGVRF